MTIDATKLAMSLGTAAARADDMADQLWAAAKAVDAEAVNGTPAGPTPDKPDPTPSVPAPVPVPTPSVDPVVFDLESWLGDWSGDIWSFVRKAVEADQNTSVFVGYNIPNRDNGNYSAGGLPDKDAFWAWYGAIADAIGDDPAFFIVEPDALGLGFGLNDEQRAARVEMIQGAINALAAKPNIEIYVDASMWIAEEKMAAELDKLTGMDGFSLNVSGYKAMGLCLSYGDRVSGLTRDKLKFVIDTSRNGNGNPHEPAWCNVTDTKVGPEPTVVTGSRNCRAYLNLKIAGESDGFKINGYDGDNQPNRNDVPPAGQFWPDYAEAIRSGEWTEFKKKYNVQ